jgi:hypothetical protein
MSQAHKLKIRIGAAEFEAEGLEDTVNRQYEQFLKALAAAPSGGGGASPAPPPPGPERRDGAEAEPAADENLVKRAFLQDKKGGVSLKVLPKSDNQEADTLLLLLYGYSIVKGETELLGGRLLNAARQSGLTLERVDYAIGARGEYIQKGGFRRGARYSLNNLGVSYARDLLRRMFD